MNPEQIAQMQKTLAGAKTKAEGIKAGLVDVGKDTKTDATQKTILDVLTKRALADGGAISSADTGVETLFKEAATAAEAVRAAGETRIERQFAEKITGIEEAGVSRLTSAREAQRGFGVNAAALRQLSKDTDRKVKDYEQMKQDALVSNDVQFASQLANLQIKELQFEQESKQRTFSNLLSISGLGLEQSREQRLERMQTNQEKQQIASIALEFGIPLVEGETLDTITAKASPFATESRMLDIQKTKVDIARVRAETEKAMAGQDFKFDSIIASSLATAYRRGEVGFLSGLKPEESSKVFAEVLVQEEAERKSLQEIANRVKARKGTIQDFQTVIEQSTELFDPNLVTTIGASTFIDVENVGIKLADPSDIIRSIPSIVFEFIESRAKRAEEKLKLNI